MRTYSNLSAYGLMPGSDLRYHKDLGLYESFIDGILEGSTDQTVVVDGNGNSHRHGVNQYAGGRYLTVEAPLKTGLTQVPEPFKKKTRVGFGIYIAGHGDAWDPQNPAKNLISPADVEDFIRMGLQFGHGYLWFWTEASCWWLDSEAA